MHHPKKDDIVCSRIYFISLDTAVYSKSADHGFKTDGTSQSIEFDQYYFRVLHVLYIDMEKCLKKHNR